MSVAPIILKVVALFVSPLRLGFHDRPAEAQAHRVCQADTVQLVIGLLGAKLSVGR